MAAALLLIAVLARRPDMAVLGLPLAFVAAWGRYFRPRETPVLQTELDADVLFEGQATTYRLTVAEALDPDVDLVVMALVPARRGSATTRRRPLWPNRWQTGTVTVEVGSALRALGPAGS